MTDTAVAVVNPADVSSLLTKLDNAVRRARRTAAALEAMAREKKLWVEVVDKRDPYKGCVARVQAFVFDNRRGVTALLDPITGAEQDDWAQPQLPFSKLKLLVPEPVQGGPVIRLVASDGAVFVVDSSSC